VFSKKRGLNRRPGPSVHDDLVERDFTAAAPNELWLTDIPEHPTGEGKLYLCAVKDVYSGRIVGYSMGPRPQECIKPIISKLTPKKRMPAPAQRRYQRICQQSIDLLISRGRLYTKPLPATGSHPANQFMSLEGCGP
jgi:hypothetical protein